MNGCVICGRELYLLKKENYSAKKLSVSAYSSRKIPEYMHWNLYECRKCRMVYSQCPIDKNAIFQNYKMASYDSSGEADDAGRTYFEYLQRHIPAYPKKKALDIGTGNGAYLKILKMRGGGGTGMWNRTVCGAN